MSRNNAPVPKTFRPLAEIFPYPKNSNTGHDLRAIRTSLEKFGQRQPIVVDGEGVVIVGHGRLAAMQEAGWKEAWVEEMRVGDRFRVNGVEKIVTAKDIATYRIADNSSAESSELDFELVRLEVEEMELAPAELLEMGVALEAFSDTEICETSSEGALARDFGILPTTVFDAKTPKWQERKKYWQSRIKNDGHSREGTLADHASGKDPEFYSQKRKTEKKIGVQLTAQEFIEKYYKPSKKIIAQGVSIFDPVLAEIILAWFTIPGGKVIDPFSGGAFGFVAGATGHPFIGTEIREEQQKINQSRADAENFEVPVKYFRDDGRNIAKHAKPEEADLLFSCPPYFDLEKYSDLPDDASNQKSYQDFLAILEKAFHEASRCLKHNRFAVIVVGDIRDKNSFYRGFPNDIVRIFEKAGLPLINEAILATSAAAVPTRARGSMKHRKLVKTHQNVLIFFKGDPKTIKTEFPSTAPLTSFEETQDEES